ncbi:MAG: methionyl-tRNA formyltransferase [Deltaproteobacteria bacterium]|nr:methionyl-tRNA formyltransferase [Deltaproteobacteria bacterium]
MRIVIHGQQAFGKAVLERLAAGADELVGVFCPPDQEGRPVDPLKEAALERGLPVRQPPTWKTDDALDLFKSFQPELCVMAYVTLLLPRRVLEAPGLGTIQYHPSLLPLHRGPSSINWARIMGDAKTGLSIFWPDEGLDEGPILLQKEVEIGRDDTVGSLYFGKLFPMGVDAVAEAVELVRSGTAPRIEQDHGRATYESWCGEEDAEVDWSRPAEEVHRLICGTDPQPGAWTTVGGKKLNLYGSRMREGSGAAGEILELSDAGMAVAAGEASVWVQRVRAHDSRAKVAAAEYAEQAGLRPGSRLG